MKNKINIKIAKLQTESLSKLLKQSMRTTQVMINNSIIHNDENFRWLKSFVSIKPDLKHPRIELSSIVFLSRFTTISCVNKKI